MCINKERVFWWENYVEFAYRTPQLDYVHEQTVFDEYESLKVEKVAVTEEKNYSELLEVPLRSSTTLYTSLVCWRKCRCT